MPETFENWYTGWAQRTGLNPDPDDPRHMYDYRAAYRAGAEPTAGPDGRFHWPSQFKAPNHPNRFVGGVDTITGQRIGGQEMAGPPAPIAPDMDLLWSLGQTGDRYPLKETFVRGDQTYKREFEATSQPTSKPAGEMGPPAPAKPLPKAAPVQGPEQAPFVPGSAMPPGAGPPEWIPGMPPDPAEARFDEPTVPAQQSIADAVSAPGFDWGKLLQYGMPLAMMAMMGLMGRKKGGGGGMAMLPLMMMLPQMMKGWGGGTGSQLPTTLRGA